MDITRGEDSMNKNLGILTEHIATQQQIQYFVCKEYHPVKADFVYCVLFVAKEKKFFFARTLSASERIRDFKYSTTIASDDKLFIVLRKVNDLLSADQFFAELGKTCECISACSPINHLKK
jgi:hypothetical protein